MRTRLDVTLAIAGHVAVMAGDTRVALPASVLDAMCADLLAYHEEAANLDAYRTRVEAIAARARDEEWTGGVS